MNSSSVFLLLLPLFALIVPFALWPVELFLPYPYIVEELAKGMLVFFALSLPHRKTQFLYAMLIGLLFSLSENVLYVFNIVSIGTLSFAFSRLFLTSLLHITTSLVIVTVSLKDKRLIVVGIFLASIIHYYVNIWLLSL